MNTENTLAGYVAGSAGQLRVAVRYDNGHRVLCFLKETQDLSDRGPWFYTYAYMVNATRKGKGLLLEAAAPLWGYPEWSLAPAELARAVYVAAEAFARVDDEALSAALRGVR
jgi:hypothetical protein